MSRIIGLAQDVYREWHQKHPTQSLTVPYEFPSKMVSAGTALKIIYASSKWEPRVYLYEHDFDTHPDVLVAPGAVPSAVRSNPAVDTKDLLNIRSFKEKLALPILATVQELTYHDGNKEVITTFGDRQPVLCSTLDKRTLVILDEPHVICISGGEMVVTERGIVN